MAMLLLSRLSKVGQGQSAKAAFTVECVEGRCETQGRKYCAIHGYFHDDSSFINEQLLKPDAVGFPPDHHMYMYMLIPSPNVP